MLSRRLLVFAGGFAVWHCRGGVWREDVNALDGDKKSVSFPWLRLTSIPPPSTTDIAQAGLEIRKQDESVRLMRLPAMDQYIEAVEDFSGRTIGKSWEVLDAFSGLQSILGCIELLDSPFRNGLPTRFLDVALLWQSRQRLRRRANQVDENGRIIRRCPPSWTWAGWEAVEEDEKIGSTGAPVYYEKPFEIQADSLGLVKRLNKLGEERIRPRKGSFYGISEKTQRLLSFGMFSPQKMGAKGFKDWDSWQARPMPGPRIDLSLFNLDERHLIVQTEVITVLLGKHCWRTRSYTTIDDIEYCRETFQTTTPAASLELTDPDIKTEISHEYIINTRSDKNVGIVTLDADVHYRGNIEAIIVSEAQYLGNETTLDVLGYPLYNIMLIERNEGEKTAERIGIGKMYKYAWRKAEPRSEVVILE